jgi:hypothetical protein
MKKIRGFRPSTFRKSILEVFENLLYNKVRSRKCILCAITGGENLQNEEKRTTSENRIMNEEVAKYTIKDSVFTNLFQDKKYLIQLYKTLHPEDMEAIESG